MKIRRLLKKGQCAVLLIALAITCPSRADTLTLRSGRTHQGLLIGTEAGYVRLAKLEENSEIELRFNPDDISAFDFDDKDLTNALAAQSRLEQVPTLERIFEKRYPFIEYISDQQRSLLLDYLQALADTQAFQRILSLSKPLKTKTLPADFLESIELLALEAAWQLGDRALAARHAQARIDSGKPAARNALPWLVLATIEFEKGNDARALSLSLHPLVSLDIRECAFANYCYALAINASSRSNYGNYPALLLAEMEKKELAWPDAIERLPANPLSDSKRFSAKNPFPDNIQLIGNP